LSYAHHIYTPCGIRTHGPRLGASDFPRCIKPLYQREYKRKTKESNPQQLITVGLVFKTSYPHGCRLPNASEGGFEHSTVRFNKQQFVLASLWSTRYCLSISLSPPLRQRGMSAIESFDSDFITH